MHILANVITVRGADMRAQAVSQVVAQRDASVRVWDRFVRLSHWTIGIGFFIAYFSEDVLTLHVWVGYVVGVVVLLRIVWGFVGPEHARFVDFLYRPSEVIAYVRGLMARRSQRFLGHSPAGGAMIVALLLGLLATVGSGLVLYAVDDNAGPLAGIVTNAPTEHTLVTADADHDDEADERHDGAGNTKAAGRFWKETHEIVANLMLLLITLHVAGVLLASHVHRENLVKAMITGEKRAPVA
jgi:cytochrome b